MPLLAARICNSLSQNDIQWFAVYTRSRQEGRVAFSLEQKDVPVLLPTWIEDCVEGILRLMASDYREPLNLGTDELVTVNELVDMVCAVAGKRLNKRHDMSKPQGVRGRNSDNTRLRKVLGWEPRTSLRAGLEITYPWIQSELEKAGRLADVLELSVR